MHVLSTRSSIWSLALNMVPDDSPDKARLFDAVGSSLMTQGRYELLREHIDLENSLLITPVDQFDDPLKLIWLGSA